jgi:hypothetical protein
MELKVVCQFESLEDTVFAAEAYLGHNLRVIRENLSVFESYQVRLADHVFVPRIWAYRIVRKGGTYYFGRLW